MPKPNFSDHDWMAAAARLSQRGIPLSAPNPSVGCVIVKNGRVLARGWTQDGGRPHAEAHALLGLDGDAKGADIYVTLEPCAHVSERGPSCADLLVKAAPARVIIGQSDPDPRTAGKGVVRLKSAGIAVELLDDANSRSALAGYLMQVEKQRPFITLKLAVSSDGFIARKAGEEQWITGEEARRHVHARRAKQDAILVGGGTWRTDNPRLDVRLPGIENRSPTRYVLSQNPPENAQNCLKTVNNVHEMTRFHTLYIEGGAQTAESVLDAGLVDRIELYTAPITISEGTKAPAGVLSPALENWQLVETCQLGSDHFAAYQRKTD